MTAYYGSHENWKKIGSWKEFKVETPSMEPSFLDHGYDETKPEASLDLEDMIRAAEFRGGECLSNTMVKGDLFTPLKWRCALGHEFEMSPNLALKGGHWCPDCLPSPWNYDAIARVNPFLHRYGTHCMTPAKITTMTIAFLTVWKIDRRRCTGSKKRNMGCCKMLCNSPCFFF